jgi:hypothetical protein
MMSQGKKIKIRPGDWVLVVNKRKGEVVMGRKVKYAGEIEKFFLIEIPVMMRQGVEWIVHFFNKEEWDLVKDP